MGRLARDSKLETREARSRLKAAHEPYWRQIHPGLFIGYRKGSRGGIWLVRSMTDGRYLKRRIGIADDITDPNGVDVLDYKQAHGIAVSKSQELTQRKAGGDKYTVGEAITDYLKWFREHRKSAVTTEQIINAHIRPSPLWARAVNHVTAKEIRQWHEGLAAAPAKLRSKPDSKKTKAIPKDPELIRRRRATANRVLSVLKAALNYAYQEGNAASPDEWRRVKPFRDVDVPRIRYLAHDECKRLINACPPSFRKLVHAALLTGCRYGELVRMKAADFHEDSGTVLASMTKGGKPRHIPLTDEGVQFFEDHTAGRKGSEFLFTREDGEAWGKSHQARRLREACAIAKITPPASFHELRHTYASLLAMKGVGLNVIAQLLGHADTRITHRHYAHLQPSYVADQLRANLPNFGLEKSKVTKIKSKSRREK